MSARSKRHPLVCTLLGALLWLSPTSLAGDLDGTYAMENVLVSASRAAIIGKLKSHSTTWVKLTLDHEGESAEVAHEVCGSEVRGTLFKSRIPPAYIAAVPSKTYTAAVTEHGTHYTSDIGVFHMGIDPACPALPTTPDHPCVRDVDGDGHPGATIQVKFAMFSWVDVYVAQRNHLTLDGRLAEDGWIRGGLTTKQVAVAVLGAKNSLFNRSPDPPEVLHDESTFRMRRIDDGASCSDVITLLKDTR
jgi:hypothetical protein